METYRPEAILVSDGRMVQMRVELCRRDDGQWVTSYGRDIELQPTVIGHGPLTTDKAIAVYLAGDDSYSYLVPASELPGDSLKPLTTA